MLRRLGTAVLMRRIPMSWRGGQGRDPLDGIAP